MSQVTFCISYKNLPQSVKCTVEKKKKDAWDAAQRVKCLPQISYDFSVADNHTNDSQVSSAQNHHLSSRMVISLLIFNFSPQNCFNHRTAPTQHSKNMNIGKMLFSTFTVWMSHLPFHIFGTKQKPSLQSTYWKLQKLWEFLRSSNNWLN